MSLVEVGLDHGVPTGVVETQSDHRKECKSDLVAWNKVPERHPFQMKYYMHAAGVKLFQIKRTLFCPY